MLPQTITTPKHTTPQFKVNQSESVHNNYLFPKSPQTVLLLILRLKWIKLSTMHNKCLHLSFDYIIATYIQEILYFCILGPAAKPATPLNTCKITLDDCNYMTVTTLLYGVFIFEINSYRWFGFLTWNISAFWKN